MGTEQSWFAIPTGARALKLAVVILGAMATYFATLWALGLRLSQFARHE